MYINTTALNGYAAVTGTSYATPHVSGAAALIMQQNPDMAPEDVRSLLISTSSSVTGQTGVRAPVHEAGTGRLDAGAALAANLVIHPTEVVASVTREAPQVTVPMSLEPLDGYLGDVQIDYYLPDAALSYSITDDALMLHMSSSQDTEGMLEITRQDMLYTIPILLHHTNGTLNVIQDSGRLWFEVSHPDGWSFAKITVTGRDGVEYRTSITPSRPSHIDVYGDGIYYVQADIVTKSRANQAYQTILVEGAPEGVLPTELPDIPWRQVAIAAAIAGVVGAAAKTMPVGRRS